MKNLEKLKEIIAENIGCEIEDIKVESRLIDDLDADSLDIVELTMAIEDEFNVSISDKELEEILTVSDILKKLEE
ncbi:MAG: acyl carrier protein [Peptoniphilaceae bacterium]